jgi:hypothetical protein
MTKDLVNYGLLPDTPEQLAEIRSNSVSFERFLSGDWEQEHGPYPQRKYLVPPDITWDSFEPELRKRKARFDKLRADGWCLWWWEIARARELPMDKVLSWQQSNLPSCSGFSAAAAYSRKVIYQMLTAPVRWDPINPFPTWTISKGYSTAGGQSMAGVKIAVSKWGNYAATDPGIGDYPGRLNKAAYENAAQYAQSRQLCTCAVPATLAALQLCLDACEVVAIGNGTACKTCRIDSNGIKIGVIAGSWAHAHNYDAIRYVHGEPYFHWSQSWGPIYKGGTENDPEIGCWHTKEAAAKMLQGASCWTTVYAEAFTGLNPGATDFAPKFVGYPDYAKHKHS